MIVVSLLIVFFVGAVRVRALSRRRCLSLHFRLTVNGLMNKVIAQLTSFDNAFYLSRTHLVCMPIYNIPMVVILSIYDFYLVRFCWGPDWQIWNV